MQMGFNESVRVYNMRPNREHTETEYNACTKFDRYEAMHANREMYSFQ